MKIKKVKNKRRRKMALVILNRIITSIVLFAFVANQAAFAFDSSTLREMASAKSIEQELAAAIMGVKSASPGSLNLQRSISEKLKQERFLEAVFILSDHEKSPEYGALREAIAKSLFDRDRTVYYKLLDSIKRIKRLLKKEQIEKELLLLAVKIDNSISNPEQRALFLNEISGYMESEFLSFEDASNKARENLFIHPQNLWLYLLPVAGMMGKELPAFIARNTILENAWKGLVAKLGSRVGFDQALSQQKMLMISSKAPFASQITSALTESELKMQVSGKKWKHLVEIYQKLPGPDREKIDAALNSRGIKGAFPSLENSTLARFIELLVDVGIDSRITEYNRIITEVKDVRRLLKEDRAISDPGYIKALFEKQIEEAEKYLEHIRLFPGLEEDARAIEEMREKMRTILKGRLKHDDIDRLVSLEQELYHRWKDRTFAYLEQLPVSSLNYSCWPIFEYLLKDTAISKQIKTGVIYIDDMTARGRTQLQCKLFARVFSADMNGYFVPIFRDRKDPAGGHYYISLLNRVPEKRPELEPVLDYVKTEGPAGASILTPVRFEERIKELERVKKRVSNRQRRILNEFLDKESRKIAMQADFADLGREVIRQALKNYLCGLQADDEKAVYGLMLREYLAPPMTMFAKVRQYKNRLDLLFTYMKANIRLDRRAAKQATEIAANLKPQEEISILKKWQREAERFQRMQDKALGVLEDPEVLGQIKGYLKIYARLRILSAGLSELMRKNRLNDAEVSRADIFKEIQRKHLELQDRFQVLRSLVSSKLNLLTEGKTEPYSIPRTRCATIYEIDRAISVRELDELTFEAIEERIRQYNGALILAEMFARQQNAVMDKESIATIQALRIPPRVERGQRLFDELAKLKKRRGSFKIKEDVTVPKPEAKQKIILVTDIGYDPDDAVALTMLTGLQDEVEIMGVVTCGDPDHPARCKHHKAKLARKLLDIQGLKGVPIFSEEDEPVDKKRLLEKGFLGADVFLTKEDLSRPASKMGIVTKRGSGADFIAKSIHKDKGIKIVSIGTTRVLNKAIKRYAKAYGKKSLPRDLNIFIMGGYLDYDRTNKEKREYNFRVFPDDTRQVIDSGANIFLMPLDITLEVCLEDRELAELKKADNPAVRAVAQMFDRFKRRRPYMHDPYTIYAMLHPDDILWCHSKIDINNKGRSRAKYAKESNVTTAYFIPQKKAAEFRDFLLKNLLDSKRQGGSFQNWIDRYLTPFSEDLERQIEEAMRLGVELKLEYIFKLRLDYGRYLERFSRLLFSLDLTEQDIEEILKAFHLAFIAHQLYYVDDSEARGFWSPWNLLTIEHQFNILKIYTEEFELQDVYSMVLIMLHDVIEDTYFSQAVLEDITERFNITAEEATERLAGYNRRLKAGEEVDPLSQKIDEFRKKRIKRELKAIFGDEIAQGVDSLSKDLSRPEIEYYHSVLRKGLREHMVKLADRKLNLRGRARMHYDYQRQASYAQRTRDNFIDLIKSQDVPAKIKHILYDSYLRLAEVVDIDASINELLSAYGCDSNLLPENRNMTAITDTEIEAVKDFLSEDIPPLHGVEENIHQRYSEIEEIIAKLTGRISGRRRFLESLLTGERLGYRRDTYRLREIIDLDKELAELDEMEELVMRARRKFIVLGMPCYHAHTNLLDDGVLSPEELVDLAIEKGITILYVAGHNRMQGYEVARRYARMRGKILEIRPAVELDVSVLGAMGFMHFVAIGPEDETVIQRMSELGDKNFEMMQGNLRWRFNRILSLADKELFETEFERARVSPRISQIGKDLKKAGLIDDGNDIEELKGKLRRWFSEVKAYADSGGNMPSEFYNKLDVLGKWTNAVWPEQASERRRAMRALFDILYPDDLVEEFSGVKMPRAQELLREFANLGCKVILAHPGFEIFTLREIPPERIEDFKTEMIAMASEGILHGTGAGWGHKRGPVIDNMADEIRARAGLTAEEFPVTYNVPDFHGEVYDDIRRGRILKDEDTGAEYYTWDGIPPDLKTYFNDGDFLVRRFLVEAEKAFYAREYMKAIRLLRMAYQTYPWHANISALRNRVYKAMRQERENSIPNQIRQKNLTVISQDGRRRENLPLKRLYTKGAVALDFRGTIADKKGLGYGIAQEIIELLNAGFRVLIVTTNKSEKIISSMVTSDGTPILDRVNEEARPNLVIYADNLTRKFVYDHITRRMEEVYGYREGKGFKTREEKIGFAMRISGFLSSGKVQGEATTSGLLGRIKFTIEDKKTQLRLEVERGPMDDKKAMRKRIKFVTKKLNEFLKDTPYRPHAGATGVYILNRNIDKATAIEDAVESYGMEEDAIIYIGDGFNEQGDEPVAQKTKALCVSVSDKHREDIVGNPVDVGGGIETTRAIMHNISAIEPVLEKKKDTAQEDVLPEEIASKEALADRLLEKGDINAALELYRANMEYIREQVPDRRYNSREAVLLHPLSRCLWFLTIENVDVEDNIHQLYREEESIILKQEASLKLQMDTLEEELRGLLREGDKERAARVITKLYYLSLKLDIVMAARSKFVEAGWHSRHTHVAGVGDHGYYSPSELIDLAYQSGLTECLVTSHDNVNGSLNLIRELRKRNKEGSGIILEVVPAAEVALPEHVKFYLPKNIGVMVAFRDRLDLLASDARSIYSGAIMAAFEKAGELIGNPDKIRELLKMGPEGDNSFKGTKFLERARRQQRNRKASNRSPFLPKGVDIDDDEAIFDYATETYNSLLEKAIISLQKRPYTGMPPHLPPSKAFAIDDFLEGRKSDFTSDELYFLKLYLKMFGRAEGCDYLLRIEGRKVKPIGPRAMGEAGKYNIGFSFSHPLRERTQKGTEEEFIDRIAYLAADKGLRWIELGYKDHTRQEMDKVKEIIAKVYEKTGILLRTEGSNPDFHGGPRKKDQDIIRGALIRDEDGSEYRSLLLEDAIDREGIFDLEEELVAPYMVEAKQLLSEADVTPESLLDVLPALNMAVETFPYRARHYQQSPSQLKRSFYSRLTETLGVVQDLSQIEGTAEAPKAETPEPFQRKEMLQRYIWHNDSPIFKDEFESESTIALQKQDIITIANAMIDEIYVDKERHIVDILKAAKLRLSDERLAASVDELLESLDKKGEFPLKNLAFQALVWAIRTWPKREYHCHISTSVSEDWFIGQVTYLFSNGIKPEISKYKKGTVSYAVAKALLESPDEQSLRNTLRSIFDSYNKGKLKGKSTALDMPFDLVPEDEKLELYFNMVSSVVKQYFQDGIFEIELSLNPHKHISYIGLDEYFTKLDQLLSRLEQEADAKFGRGHKIYLKFSLNQVNFEAKGKRQELTETIRQICELKKEAKKDYLWRFYAIDISGKEVPGMERSAWFEEIIRPAQEAGFIFTVHSGDPTNVDKAFEKDMSRHLDYVRDTASIKDIRRIGHGRILSKADPRTNANINKKIGYIIGLMAKKGIGVECCPLRAYRDIQTLRNHSLYYWKAKGLDLFFGIDGHYYVPSTLSQWIAQVLLVSPGEESKGYISFADMERTILPEETDQDKGGKLSSSGEKLFPAGSEDEEDLAIRPKIVRGAQVDFMEIHPTNVCNLQCFWCTYNQRHDQKVFPFENLEKIARFNPKEILIVGGGEPTIYKYGDKDFNDFIMRLRELLPHTKLMLATNGTLIPKGEWTREIYDVGISVHGLKKESFLKNTERDLFDVLYKNIFDGYILNTPIKRILLSVVYTNYNLNAILSFVEKKIWPEWERVSQQLRNERKDEKEFLFILLPCADDSSPDEPYKPSRLSEEQKKDWMKKLDAIKEEKPEFWKFLEEHAPDFITKPFKDFSASPTHRCWTTSNYVLAAADGYIYPCFMQAIKMPGEGVLGTALDSPEEILGRRRELLKDSYPRCKAGCRVANTLMGAKVLESLRQLHGRIKNVSAALEIVNFLGRRDKLPKKADLIMVLGSKDKRVPVEAAKLFKKGLAGKILVSGSSRAEVKDKISREEREAHVYKRILMEQGVPEEAIIIEDESTSMDENIRFSKKILEKRNIPHNTVILVQAPLDQRFAGEIFKKYFGMEAFNYAAYIPDISGISDRDLLKVCKRTFVRLSMLSEASSKREIGAIDIPTNVVDAKSQLREGIIDLMIRDLAVSEGKDFWTAKAEAIIWIKLVEQGDWFKTKLTTTEDIHKAANILREQNDFTIAVIRKGLDIKEAPEATKLFPAGSDGSVRSSSAGDDWDEQKIIAEIKALNEAVYRGNPAKGIPDCPEFGPDPGRDIIIRNAVRNSKGKYEVEKIPLPGVGITELEYEKDKYGNHIVSYIIYGMTPSDIQHLVGDSVYIHFMAVHLDMRGQDRGKDLFRRAIAFARKKAINKIALNVRKDNPFRGFYDKIATLPGIDGAPKTKPHRFEPPPGIIGPIAETYLYEYDLGPPDGATSIKSSSAGKASDISGITAELTQAKSALVSAEAGKLDEAILDATVSAYQKAIDKLKALKAESAEKAVSAAEPLRKAEASLGVMTLSRDIAKESANLKNMAGTIIINDAEIPANQKILLTLLDKENSYLKALEEKLGCKIRLLSQFDLAKDASANMVAISTAKIPAVSELRYLDISRVTDDAYLPLEQAIVFAKGLLVYAIDNSDVTKGIIAQMYRLLAKKPAEQELFEQFLNESVFSLVLPSPTPVDEKYYQDLHKQAMAALIAA